MRHIATLVVLWALIHSAHAVEVSKVERQLAGMSFKPILEGYIERIGEIQSIVQDRHGFIWMGGQNGLIRYDGTTPVLFKNDPENKKAGSLTRNQIFDLEIDHQGVLWVASSFGIMRYDEKTETFVDYYYLAETKYREQRNYFTTLHVDSAGDIWVGGREGLFEFDRETEQLYPHYLELSTKDNGSRLIHDIDQDSDGYLWIGSAEGGLTRYHPTSSQVMHFRHRKGDEQSLSSNDIRKIMIDSQGQIWASVYGKGINVLSKDRRSFWKVRTSAAFDDVRDILEDNEGDIWVSNSRGLFLFDETKRSLVKLEKVGNKETLVVSNVRALFKDQDHNLWISTFPAGVNVLDRVSSLFDGYYIDKVNNGLLDRVSDTALLKNGLVMIATGSGLNTFDPISLRFTSITHEQNSVPRLTAKSVISVAEDHEGHIWAGLWAAGIDRINPETNQVTHYAPGKTQSGLHGQDPWDILVDRSGTVWVATEEGLHRFDTQSEKFEFFRPIDTVLPLTEKFYARTLMQSSDGLIWVGSTKGAFKFNPETRQFFRYHADRTKKGNLIGTFAMALFEDSNNTIWVGTKNGGLNKLLDTEKFSLINREDGLPEDIITSIVEDDEKQLWVSTFKGISRVSMADHRIKNFDSGTGLAGDLYHKDTGLKLPDGRLLFGSTEGITLFDPRRMDLKHQAKKITVSDLYVLNQRHVGIGDGSIIDEVIPDEDTLRFHYTNATFALIFSSLNYTFGFEKSYRYQLQDYDRQWQEVEEGELAKYTNVAPGDYTLVIKSLIDGVESGEEKHLHIVVSGPVWLTWWAIAAYCVLGAALIGFIVQFYIKHQRYLIATERHDNMKALDKIKDEFLANTAHELRTPLNGIIGISQNLIDMHGKSTLPADAVKALDMINFSGRRLANLINDILDYSKLKSHAIALEYVEIDLHQFIDAIATLISPLMGSKPIVFKNKVDIDFPSLWVDEKRLQQIFFNLIGNAIKFTDEGDITVSAELQKPNVVITIADTGCGIEEDKLDTIFQSYEQVVSNNRPNFGGTGLGLSITKKLIEIHEGSIYAQSEVGQGSKFIVTLPINKSETGLNQQKRDG